MPSYTCHVCGNGSLVRSNFKGLSDGRFVCRKPEWCSQRLQQQKRWADNRSKKS